MERVSAEQFKKIQKEIRVPEGTITFHYHSQSLFDSTHPGGIILEIPTGQQYFRLERDTDLVLHFYHYSPGTQTRVASIDLKKSLPVDKVFIAFSWSPTEIRLDFGPMDVENGKLLSA